MDKDGNIKWQKIHPPDAPRAGGAGFGDITGDGKPELMTRGAVGSFGNCVIIRDNSGTLLCKQNTGNSAAPNGPFLFDYQNDGTLELIVGGNTLKIYRINYEASAETKSNNTNTEY